MKRTNPVVLPPCGHIDRSSELTEIGVPSLLGHVVILLVCSVEGCPEYSRIYVDLRDPPEDELDEECAPG